MDKIQRTLSSCEKVFVFKVPPLTGGRGYQAKQWDKTPIWTGRLRVVAQGKTCAILLEHTDKEGLFASCPVKNTQTVIPVTDSSRYFVLRIQSSSGKSATIGIGFDQRQQSFDFKATLQDFQTQAKAEMNMKKLDKDVKIDYSLPADGKIKVKLAGKLAARVEKKREEKDDDGSDPYSFAPPPSSGSEGKKRSKKSKKKKKKKHKSKDKTDLGSSGDEKEPSAAPEVEDILGFGSLSMGSEPATTTTTTTGGSAWEAF